MHVDAPHLHRLSSLSTRTSSKETPESNYRHILVPMGMLREESSAVTMALQLSRPHQTNVTLLHMLPELSDVESVSKSRSSTHWLDAIDMLHEELSPTAQSARLRERLRRFDQAQNRLKDDLERKFPNLLKAGFKLRSEICHGDPANEILNFCKEKTVDLVILTVRRSWWGLPSLTTEIRRLLRKAQQSVLIVSPHPNCNGATLDRGET